ncbi:hypothetical protein DNHGIG_17290 [Collibacillus ludicampi]|uniref:Major facilitator superfamily (MFS) profile domain-containing protein n=1 Tax=Collibacillus ludicampi TaxID=2771369 RepID=A0AAV4LEE0_9BACL|nr:hypothetical protein DNHGIG_17290 [Collibacillus ludicampi]
MSNTWKIYMLTLISFLVGTSQFVIVGILDKVAASVDVSVSAAGQLISVFQRNRHASRHGGDGDETTYRALLHSTT